MSGKSKTRYKRIIKSDLIIIDDVMYMAYEPQDAHLFFQFIYEMYDKAAFILTSNKGPGEWGKFLGDTTLTTAILDRLLHRSEILTFSEEQDSIRMKYRKALFNNQMDQPLNGDKTMSLINAEEAIRFFYSYGLRVDQNSVKEWVKETNKKAHKTVEIRTVVEDDLLRYNDWCLIKGTAYEQGIDDTTKIARLLEENDLLKKEVEKLKNENQRLEDLLGFNDWIWK